MWIGKKIGIKPVAKALTALSFLLFWTPTLAVFAGLLVTIGYRHAPRWSVFISMVAFGAIASFTLLAAPLLRLSLGKYDIRYSDIGRISSIFQKRLPHSNNDREALALYFLGLISVSVLCFAMMFQSINAISPGSFVLDRGEPTALSWLYLSAMTASTLGDGDTHAIGVPAQLGLMLQAITGPLIVFWLIAILVDRGNN